MKTKSHYDVLGVHKSADKSDIRRAYIMQARIHHPDKNGNSPEATERFQAIQNAYEVLFDDQQRSNYDKWEMPGIERKQREEAERAARGEPEPEEEKKEEQSQKETGGFEYEETPQERDFKEWQEKKKKEREEAEKKRKWGDPDEDETKIPAPKTKEEMEKDKEMENLSKLMKDGKHSVIDGNNIVDHYTKSGNKLSYKSSDEKIDPRAIEAMIDHAMKVSKPPLKLTGGGEFMAAAMKACEKKGVAFEGGNINPANFFRR